MPDPANPSPPTTDPAAPPPPTPSVPAPAQPDPLAALQHDLEQTRQTLGSLKRERDITRALFAEGINDLDIGAVLVERDLAAKPSADIPSLVRDLKQRKPQLFRRAADSPAKPTPQPAPRPSPTMSPRPSASDSPRDRAAAAASSTNSRPSLLAYMRLRRAPS